MCHLKCNDDTCLSISERLECDCERYTGNLCNTDDIWLSYCRICIQINQSSIPFHCDYIQHHHKHCGGMQ